MSRRCLTAAMAVLFLAGTLGAARAQGMQAETDGDGRPLLRSLLWPGMGQIAQGRTGRGAMWAGGAVTLGFGLFASHMHYHSAALDYENAKDSYRRALDDGRPEDAAVYYAMMDDLGPIADDRYDIRMATGIALALWWGGSLLDTWLYERGDGGAETVASAGSSGRLQPVLRGGAPGLAWTFNF